MSQLMLEALDGFIMIILTDGQLFYVSESVQSFLGYSQATLIHQSLFKFLHVDDHKSMKENLVWMNKESNSVEKYEKNEVESAEKSFTCRLKCTLTHGGGFYKMFQCRGKMREIHFKKKEHDSVEYGLFAVISPVNNNNTISSASTMGIVHKDASLMTTHRRFSLDHNMNMASPYPTTPQYGSYIDLRNASRTPGTEPVTPNDSAMRPSFFPPSFPYMGASYATHKRLSSTSSGVNDDSSVNDEKSSNEGSVDENSNRRRVSFFIDDEEQATDGEGRREKINHRRLSLPVYSTTPTTPAGYDSLYAAGMFNPSLMFSSALQSPLPSPLLSYQDLIQRPLLAPGLLSPMYSPGGMYPPYSPNPYMRRTGSFPSLDAAMYPAGMTGIPGDNSGLMSPTLRMHGYDPFSYFMSNPLNNRRPTSDGSPTEVKKEPVSSHENTTEEDDEEVNVTEDIIENQEPEKHDRKTNEIALRRSLEKRNTPAKIKNNKLVKNSRTQKVVRTTTNGSTTYRGDLKNRSKLGKKSEHLQETLADIAQSFTSKLDSIRSSFSLNITKNVADCIGKSN